MNGKLVCLSAALLVAALAGVCLAGCGGGGSSGTTPDPTGSTTLRGTISLPAGQSANDVVVRVEGTSLQARPNADGSFEIRGVPPGMQTVSAVSPTANIGAHVAVTVPRDGTAFVPPMRLGAGGQIAGIVTAIVEDGSLQARAGATISARPAGDIYMLQEGSPVPPPSGGGTDPVDPEITLTAVSAADGTFAIKGVAPGSYRVAASLEGFDAQERFVYVDVAHTAATDFVFGTPPAPKLGGVQGKVVAVTAAGRETPVVGARVWSDMPMAMTTAGGSSGSGVAADGSVSSARKRQATSMIYPMPPYYEGFFGVTDENGAFTLRLPAGRHTIHCQHPDYQEGTAEVDVVAEQVASVRIVVQPVPGERPRLSAALRLEKSTFAPGEAVRMSLFVKNEGTGPVSVSFDGREAFFGVWRGEELAWIHGDYGMVPMPMPMPMPMPVPAPGMEGRGRDVMNGVLPAGETREYRVVWDQRRLDGGWAANGDYAVRAGVQLANLRVEADAVRLRIGQ